MNARDKARTIETALERRMGISRQKGAEYSGAGTAFEEDSVDTLANFKRNAEKLGLHPVQILALYLNKHIDSYDTFIREFGKLESLNDHRTLAATGEGIISRLDDMRNYLDLLECLLVDMNLVGPITEDHFITLIEEAIRADQAEWEEQWASRASNPLAPAFEGTDETPASNRGVGAAGEGQMLPGYTRDLHEIVEFKNLVSRPGEMPETEVTEDEETNLPLNVISIDEFRQHAIEACCGEGDCAACPADAVVDPGPEAA